MYLGACTHNMPQCTQGSQRTKDKLHKCHHCLQWLELHEYLQPHDTKYITSLVQLWQMPYFYLPRVLGPYKNSIFHLISISTFHHCLEHRGPFLYSQEALREPRMLNIQVILLNGEGKIKYLHSIQKAKWRLLIN